MVVGIYWADTSPGFGHKLSVLINRETIFLPVRNLDLGLGYNILGYVLVAVVMMSMELIE